MRNFVDEKITEHAAMRALGMLSQPEALVFEESLKDEREGYDEELAAFDAVVAALAFGAPEQTPSKRTRNRLLLSIASEAETAEIPVVQPKPVIAPRYYSVKMDEGQWDQVAEGVFIKTLFVNPTLGSITALVKLAPGTRLPRHRHPGIEESIVIEGDCRVNGEILRPGDYRRAMEGTTDSEVTTERGTVFLMMTTRKVEILES
jgi:putative transcriptional regulator